MYSNMSRKELLKKLEALSEEHRDLDYAIQGFQKEAYVNQLKLQRLKKRKLKLKDQITLVKSFLIPDLNA